MSISMVLAETGYIVSPAEDGFSALREIRREMPDILLSDLNMPGMSGFELLPIVRQQFPAIQTIAMSGAFSGDEVPTGIAADAYYAKGGGVGKLLQIIRTLPQTEGRTRQSSSVIARMSLRRDGHDSCLEASLTITRPECLRTFPLTLDDLSDPVPRNGMHLLPLSDPLRHRLAGCQVVDPMASR
jgi:CheY-like chemotaxis protein